MTIKEMMDAAGASTPPATDGELDELAAEVMRRCYRAVVELHEKSKTMVQMELNIEN